MKLKLLSKKSEVPGVTSFVFEPSQAVVWQPGQYMHYVIPLDHPDERGIERWFTISSAPFEQNIMLTTRFDGKKVSAFKQFLQSMPIGSEMESDGPKGSFTLQPQGHHILIAGGIGITPYRSMLAQLAHDGQQPKIDLLYANRDQDFAFGQELEAVAAKNPSWQIVKFIDKRIEKADLAPYLADPESIFYLSGPRPMVEAYEQLLKDSGVTEDKIKTDYFPGY